MPRETSLQALYSDVDRGIRREDLLAQAAETRDRLRLDASVRPDLAGDPLNLALIPQSYQQRVMRMWEAYGSDPLFKRLIDRVVEFCANGSRWEIPDENNESSWIQRVDTRRRTVRETRLEREEDFWNHWANSINMGVPNVLPGMDQLVAWATRHLLLSGMFIPHWQLGRMDFGRQTYVVPTAITCYPASAITLRRQQSMFMQEDILYFRPINLATTMIEGQWIEAPSFMPRVGLPLNMVPLAQMSKTATVGDTEAFALKMNWSPGDVVGIRRGQINTTGQGVYPQPPFFSLSSQFAIRQKLFHADLAILDGIINFLMLYKIGDKDHPPKAPKKKADGTVLEEGTIATVRRLVQEGRIGPAMELFVPYYVDLTIKQPDSAVLLSDTKYGASATEIMAAFGILYARTAAGSRERMDKINISGFEEFLGGVRQQIRSFLGLLASHIRDINANKLKQQPVWSPNPLNTKSESFMQELVKLKSMGAVSLESLLRYHGLDSNVELRRIATELGMDVDDLTNENVPLTFIQQMVQPEEEDAVNARPDPRLPITNRPRPATKQTSTPGTRRGGRPPGKATEPRVDKGTSPDPRER